MNKKIYIDTVSVSFMTQGGMFNRTFNELVEPYRFIAEVLKNKLVILPDTLDVEVTYTWEDGKQLTFLAVNDFGMSEQDLSDSLSMQDLLESWSGKGKHFDKYGLTATKAAGEMALLYYGMLVSRNYEGFCHLEEDYGKEVYESAVEQYQYVTKSVEETNNRLNHMLSKSIIAGGKDE